MSALKSRRRHALERGQTFPVWVFGVLTAMALMFFIVNYANVVYWQVRAQNVADAAAGAAISPQSSSWNQMLVLLYASTVEEWRVRRLIDMMLLTLRWEGGCYNASSGTNVCAANYAYMRTKYESALLRYTTDVSLMQRASTKTFADNSNDAARIIAFASSECSTGFSDCSFAYSLDAYVPRTSNLQSVQQDALGFNFGAGAPTGISPDLEPAELQVSVCHNVTPIIPSFFLLHFGTFQAVGRAAATTIMTTQEWLQPGSITDPWTNYPFQPVEDYETGTPTWNVWYTASFTGNNTTTVPAQSELQETFAGNEFTTFTGWWSSVPAAPFVTPKATANCL